MTTQTLERTAGTKAPPPDCLPEYHWTADSRIVRTCGKSVV
jgi:hypothetical protein